MGHVDSSCGVLSITLEVGPLIEVAWARLLLITNVDSCAPKTVSWKIYPSFFETFRVEKTLKSTGRVNNVWIAPELLFYEGGRTREARKSHTNRHFNRSELQCVQRGPERPLLRELRRAGSVERDRKRLRVQEK